MNKNKIIIFSVIFIFTSGVLFAQNAVNFDNAIKTAISEIENKLKSGVKVVVLNFKSSSPRFSDYTLDEIMTLLVQNQKVTVVDRANLALIQQEMNFQMSGEVSDSSAQAIGQKLGAQSIISGSVEDLETHYRMRFRTIEVETAAIQVLTSVNVRKDRIINSLMTTGGTSTAVVPTPVPAVVPAPVPVAPAPVVVTPTPIPTPGVSIDTGTKPIRKIPARAGNFEITQGTRVRTPIDMNRFYHAAVTGLGALNYPVDMFGTGFIVFSVKGNNWWCQFKLCYWYDEYWYEYINSYNLDANPARNKIHKNYPAWIERVERQLAANYR